MAEITSTNGYTILIDDEDLPLVSQWNWHIIVKKGLPTYAITKMKIDGKWKTVLLHRFILGVPKNVKVDHQDVNPLNNSRKNLRVCTQSQNSANRRPMSGGFSSYKGVCRNIKSKRKPFQATICFNYKKIYIGAYKTEIEAAQAYDAKARAIFGSFALTNF